MKKAKKKYWHMTADELAEATREFDREGVADSFRPMTAAEEATWQAAVKKRPAGRPKKNGRAVRVISVGIDAALLKRADAVAKRRGVTRGELVEQALKAALRESEK
jgi:hypothetical protein